MDRQPEDSNQSKK